MTFIYIYDIMSTTKQKEIKKMFGIYKFEAGLKFTGKIAKTRELAEKYLGETYGRIEKVWTGKWDENGYPTYEDKFVPQYNKEAFVIKELEIVE